MSAGAHRRGLSFLLLSLSSLAALSCAAGPPPRSQLYRSVAAAPETGTDPGSLLEADAMATLPSWRAKLLLLAASPLVLGARFKTGVLDAAGYGAWRSSRLGGLSDVRPISIVFTARLPEGGFERQSGTIFLPVAGIGETRELTWLIFAKGTELRRDYTPSRGRGLEMPFIALAAALGYAVWVPDYSGMGEGRGIHEFCVAESLADSVLDGFAAARRCLGRAGAAGQGAYKESGRFALIGYSEGGLAVMGALKAIADRRIAVPGLVLEAAYPMGAPLNLGIGSSDLGGTPYALNHPEYQVFLALGWARAYPGELRLAEVLRAEAIEKIVPLYGGTMSDKEVEKAIERIVGKAHGAVTDTDLFTPEYLSILRRPPMSTPLSRLQEEARLDRWTPPPGMTIILAATPSDDIVPFSNSWNEYEWLQDAAPQADVSLVQLGGEDHISAGAEAFLFSIVDLEKRESERDF
jgi:pimeloyl-ACP methyl ester carboxylesterase